MNIYKTHNDQQLLTSLKDRDDAKAFEEIYLRYFDQIFRFVYKVMQDKEIAEDLVQNIFFDLWKNRNKVQIQMLSAYFFGAARNQIAKEIRKNKWNREQLKLVEDFFSVSSTEEYLDEKETKGLLESAILKLPTKCRAVFELSRFKYLSNKEIAQKTGLSVFTVENHIKKALFHLRQSIEFVVLFLLLK
ncbi:RNA polymerase sigma factor [Pleomorphovibrio marinus]|uniref:RNA polymerase sigma factor n=1 Tax=Pleomorphovibrio marinus TaxID=2164132 RepID=UPI000E0B5A43|nr:RNA polymerase sigma-70 factor [Pleomorphovibrio marinus]